MYFRMGFLGLLATVALVLLTTTATAEPVADNIVVSQRADGSGMVDIYYDLSGGVGEITVEVIISNDGGISWTVTPQPEHLAGDVGVVATGAGKHIVWNGMADQPDICWPQMQIQLSVTDEMPEPGDELTINLPGDLPLTLVYIPAGTFLMGSYPGQQDAGPTTEPQHPVTISNGFWIGKYEVTQQQWLALMGSWPGTAPNATYGVGGTYPAYYVSWNDAKNFINTLNTYIAGTGQETIIVRLPSDAEFEYACRAGTTTRFYWGDDPDYTQIGNYAWYEGNNSPFGTKPVGGKLPNAYGLYDMSGNLWELCEDDWHTSYTGAPADGSAWIDTPRTDTRITRCGPWSGFNYYCCSTSRSVIWSTNDRVDYVGFRVAAITPCDPDLTPPVITLVGDAAVSVVQGSTYTDAGATADDFCEGDLTASIIVGGDMVDTNTLGTYIITYNVSDAASNAAGEVTRTVVVEEMTITLPGDVPLELVYIPAGTFMMGRYAGEQESGSNEDPQHSVTIAQGIYMGKYEVTQQQWLAVMGSWPGTVPSSTNGVGDAYPAYYVSWDDTKNFITALNTHITNTSQGPATVRLPSEAEWEYACRAGTTTRFYFGDSLGCAADCTDCATGVLPGNRTDYMWYCGNNSPNGSKSVGGKLPNAFGLYDMSGNLWEWIEDDYHSSYTGASADGSAWVDAPRATSRVLRGGYWSYHAYRCRSAARWDFTPDIRDNIVGFRISRTP